MSHDMRVKLASKFRLIDYHFEFEKKPGEVYYVIFKLSVKLVGSVGGVELTIVSCCHCKCLTEITVCCDVVLGIYLLHK